MLWIEAFHVIFIVTWFSAVFYLPRLFVYHAMSTDEISDTRFKIMERKLYFGIGMPSAVLATIFGIWLLCLNFSFYIHQGWMQVKLFSVVLLWIYHLISAKYLFDFKHNRNQHSHVFYRWFNEAPVIILILVMILVIVKPSFHLF